MTHKDWERLGAASGILAVVTMLTGFSLPEFVTTDATAAEIRQYYLDNHDALLGQAVLIGAGVLLFLLFVGTLRNVLRRTETGTGEVSAVMSGSALVMVAMVLTCVGASAGLAYRSAEALDAPTVRLVFDLITVGFIFIGIPTAVFLGTGAVLMRRSEVFPAFAPVIAGIAAVINALAPISLFFTKGAWGPLGVAGFAPPLAFMLVVLAAGVVLVRHPEAGEARAPAPAMTSPA